MTRTGVMDRNTRYTVGPNSIHSSGIPKLQARPSTFGNTAAATGVRPCVPNRSSLNSRIPGGGGAGGMNRQTSLGQRGSQSAIKPPGSSMHGMNSNRKSILMSARKSNQAQGAGSSGGLFTQTPQCKGRSSFNPGSAMSSVGRSSVGTSGRSAQEDRPISEVSYHKHCIQKLNDFLVDVLKQPALNPRFMSAPSSSDIRRVFDVLLREMGFDLSSLTQQGKPWDQGIADLMRSLGYKYPIVKKNLAVSTTSTHAKGQLFGLFEWMVDSLSYIINTDYNRVMFPEEVNNLDIRFLEIVLGPEDQQDSRIKQLYGDVYGTDSELKNMQADELKRRREVDGLEGEIQEWVNLQDMMKKLNENQFAQDEYNRAMEGRIGNFHQTSAAEMEAASAKMNLLQQDLKKLEKKKESLLLQLNEQEFGQDDLKWSIERQDQIKKEIDSSTKGIEELKKHIRTVKLEGKQHEDQLFKLNSDLYTCLMSLKEAVFSSHLEPYVGRIRNSFQGPVFKEVCEFLPSRVWLQNMSGDDVRDKKCKLDALIQELKMEIVQQSVAIEGNVTQEFTARVRDFEAKIAENERVIQSLNQEIADLQAKQADQSKQNDMEYATISQQYESRRKYLQELNDNLCKSEEEITTRIEKLQHILDLQRKELDIFQNSEVAKFKEMVNRRHQAMKEADLFVQSKVNLMKEYKENIEREAERQEIKHKKIETKLRERKEKVRRL